MYRDFNGGDRIYNAGSPYVTGDGIKMQMAVGAQLWHMDNHTMSCGYFHGIKVPDFETCFIRQFYMVHGAWMEVAADSTRYYNEADSYQRQHMKYYSHGQYVDVPHLPLSAGTHHLRRQLPQGPAHGEQLDWLAGDLPQSLQLVRGQLGGDREGLDCEGGHH